MKLYETFSNDLKELENKAKQTLIELLDEFGETNKYYGATLRIDHKYYPYIRGNYIVDVTKDELFDDDGRSYEYSDLNSNDFLTLVDNLVKKYRD